MTESKTISRLDSNLRYWINGPEAGPLVAFSHGATLDHQSFDAQIPPLVAAGYRVLTWDLRGHGESTPIGQDISAGILADDLLSIIDQLRIDKVTLVGHSFGGYVVQEFTRRYPDRVSALVIIGCTNMAKRSAPAYRLLYRIMPKLLNRMKLETFRKRTLTDLSLLDEVKTYATKAMEGISKEDFLTIIMTGVACLWVDSEFDNDYVIPVPFLLTHGDSDRANGGVFLKESPIWAEQETNCDYKIIPNAGHTAHMDNPVTFNETLLDFLKKHVR
jgi:3-oxoadipate enol-lactonase